MRVLHDVEGGSAKSQMKKASKEGAEVAVIIGGEEVMEGEASIKYLKWKERGGEENKHEGEKEEGAVQVQRRVKWDSVVERVEAYLRECGLT